MEDSLRYSVLPVWLDSYITQYGEIGCFVWRTHFCYPLGLIVFFFFIYSFTLPYPFLLTHNSILTLDMLPITILSLPQMSINGGWFNHCSFNMLEVFDKKRNGGSFFSYLHRRKCEISFISVYKTERKKHSR